MTQRTADEWADILTKCGVTEPTTALWAPVFADVFSHYDLSQGDTELDDFLGQVLHESAHLTHLSENLNYSAERLMVVWPHRFPTLEMAKQFEHKPELLANMIYGGRMGNVNAGDGWKYRGRSPIQITGHDNYAHVGDLMGQDLVNMPELLEQPRFALEACVLWWEASIPDDILGDPEKVTKRVNGGLIGLADREQITNEAREALA
jgi:putative chitinase